MQRLIMVEPSYLGHATSISPVCRHCQTNALASLGFYCLQVKETPTETTTGSHTAGLKEPHTVHASITPHSAAAG
jgi:hypothetical protein